VVITPDHPPMNELVRPEWGELIGGGLPFTHPADPQPALLPFGNLSVTVSPEVRW